MHTVQTEHKKIGHNQRHDKAVTLISAYGKELMLLARPKPSNTTHTRRTATVARHITPEQHNKKKISSRTNVTTMYNMPSPRTTAPQDMKKFYSNFKQSTTRENTR
jgi:hypothetical protein